MGNAYGVQFDASANEVSIGEGTQDMPPFVHGFRLSPTRGQSALNISFGPQEWPGADSMASDRAAVFSEHVEKRNVFDTQGQLMGEDSWGYLSSGERWRRMRLRGFVYANYDFADESDSAAFDRIINSACLLSAPAS